jgi:hypothetical protein
MKPTRPPRGRKPHLLTRLEALTRQVRALGFQAYSLGNELQALRCEADRQRNPHNPRTRLERLAKEARRG